MSTAYSLPKPPKSSAIPRSGRKTLPGSRFTFGQPTSRSASAIASLPGMAGGSAFQFQMRMSGSADGSRIPRVMKWSVSHMARRPSVSASTATQSLPEASLIRLTMLPGWNRENLASNASTQPCAALSNEAAWESPPGAVYCTSHWVAIARNVRRLSGRSAPRPAGTGSGARFCWEKTAIGFRASAVAWRGAGAPQCLAISTDEIWKLASRSAWLARSTCSEHCSIPMYGERLPRAR